jgi:hypothetical protein
MPFDDFEANLGLAMTLKENIESLKDAQIPLSVPVVPIQEQPQPQLTVDQGQDDRKTVSPSGFNGLGRRFFLYERLAAAKMS